MVLFSILMLILLALIAVTVTAIVLGGTGFVILFGDVIVCIVLIALLIKFLAKRRK